MFEGHGGDSGRGVAVRQHKSWKAFKAHLPVWVAASGTGGVGPGRPTEPGSLTPWDPVYDTCWPCQN